MQQPQSPAAITLPQAFQAAVQLHQAGRLPQAEAVYRQILAADPAHPDALHGLGVVALQLGHPAVAVDLLRQAVGLGPGSAEFHNNLGLALRAAGQPADAAAAHRRALELRPDDPEAFNNLALALRDAGQKAEAEAEAAFRRAIALGPATPHLHNNLGNFLRDEERYDEAVAAFRAAIGLRPDYAKAYSNLGTALQYRGEVGEALKAFRKAIELEPGFAHGHWNRSLALLAVGEWAEGWTEYEWRWQCAEYRHFRRHFSQPEWDGSDPAGKIVLLTPEQGLGDTIQFVRFAPVLAAKGARVWVLCEPGLESLVRSVEGVSRIIPDPGVNNAAALPPGFDMDVPLLSLPARLGTTLQTLPAAVPYLRPDSAKVAAWRERVGRDGAARLRVGLVWAGKTIPDPRRTCGLAALAPLAAVPGVTFYSLQKGDAAREAASPPQGMTLVDVTNDLHDLEETAALIVNLDLVVTIDTAVAHLAGALGKPTWTLLRFAADWRWMTGRDDSPWYPTMRLFRQPSPGDWAAVAGRIADELRAAAAGAPVLLPPPALPVAPASATPPPPPGPQRRKQLDDLTDAAMAHLAGGRMAEAELACRQALELQPEWPDALNTLGLVVQQGGRRGLALEFMRRSLAANPNSAVYRTNYGTVLAVQGRHREAADEFRAALRLDPNLPEIHNNLGAALMNGGRIDEAMAEFQHALRLRPNYPEALTSLGVALTNKGRLAEAEAFHRRALELNANYANAHNNLGLTLLLGGNLAAGFVEYEWRWRTSDGAPFRRNFHQPQWNGEDLRGKTILLLTEQGFGDALQFARYAPLVAQCVGPGGRVLVECQPELAALLATIAGVSQVIPRGHDLPPFDVYSPLLSLPRPLGTTLATVPNRVPYLAPDPARAAAWGEKLAALAAARGVEGRLRVGLVWAGNVFHKNDRNRSCGLAAMAPLAALSAAGRAVFFGLQVGSRAEDAKTPPPGMDLIDLSADLRDFGDTAAVASHLDLVISVDTAVCHLAGALGRPTWVLLPFTPDWRWMLGRDDSPWYPTMRLFRQPEPGAWGPVLGRVAEALAQFADDRRGAAETNSPPAAPAPSPERLKHLNDLAAAAMQHLAAGRLGEAERVCREAMDLEPDWPPAMNTLGLVAHHTGRPALALDLMTRSVAARPGDAEFRTHQGLVLAVQGDTAGAIAAFRAAAELKPDAPEAFNNLGVALTATGQTAEAAAAFRAALRLWPEPPAVPPPAADRKAVRAAQRTANAHKNLGIALLLGGDLAAGFPEYEWRWRTGEPTTVRQDFTQPRWRGEDAGGKTLLLQTEQGFGDAIQFVRYAALAADRVGPGGQIVLECQPQLAALFAGVAGVNRVIPRGQSLPPFDFHAPLLSLPAVFGTTLDTLPSRVPYLAADPAKAAAWADRLAALTPPLAGGGANRPLRVGLAWTGSESHPALRRRSLPLDALAPLAAVPGVVFYSLQVGPAAAQAARPPAGMTLVDLSAGLRDFADTAAVVSHLDVVISVDTAVCHLAGAMGKPTWTLLMAVPDWRWLLGRDDSPWYPTMRLFRQPSPGDWGPAVRRVAEELEAMTRGRASSPTEGG